MIRFKRLNHVLDYFSSDAPSLVRNKGVRSSVTQYYLRHGYLLDEEVCDFFCICGCKDFAFSPLSEVVYSNNDVAISTGGFREGTENVYPYRPLNFPGGRFLA